MLVKITRKRGDIEFQATIRNEYIKVEYQEFSICLKCSEIDLFLSVARDVENIPIPPASDFMHKSDTVYEEERGYIIDIIGKSYNELYCEGAKIARIEQLSYGAWYVIEKSICYKFKFGVLSKNHFYFSKKELSEFKNLLEESSAIIQNNLQEKSKDEN